MAHPSTFRSRRTCRVSRSPYPLDIVCSNQASATRNYSAAIPSEDPATIRIGSRPAQHLDVASRRRCPMRARTSYKPTFGYLLDLGEPRACECAQRCLAPRIYVETRKTFHRSNRHGHDDRSAIVDFTNRFVWYRSRWVRAWRSRPSRRPAPVLACRYTP